jgi:Mrp family chromosome partitioning ATPase
MATDEQLNEILNEMPVPGVTRSLDKMNLIRDVSVANGKANITLASAALSQGTQDWLKNHIKDATSKLSGIKEVDVGFVDGKPRELNRIGHVIAVMSGKGGVGKSLVAGLAAVGLQRQGYEVGILDADITGPSIPKMFGMTARPGGSESGLLPVTSKSGIEIMSINLLLPGEDEAVIWRGPLIGKAITQFWEDVLWGRLDYLIVDLPPGTADAPLTVMQTLPISGIIIVFTPQDLTTMIVRKALSMAQQMNKPILGAVENMSYLHVPEINKNIELFGESKAEKMATAAKAPLLAKLPIDPELAKLCDEGNIERYDADPITKLGETLSQAAKSPSGKEQA